MSPATDKDRIRERYACVDTSNVADVLDTLGYTHQSLASDFRVFPASGGKLAGWAHTIRGQMMPYGLGGDPEKMRACAQLRPGEVSVWSGDGDGVCYFGELIAIGMKERGCVGSVVDGGIRDIKWIGSLNFPVFARYRTPTQSITRWKVTASQVPVFLRGATSRTVAVNPGDFVLGDEDGVIIIPAAAVMPVLEKAEALTRQEESIRGELRNGMTLADALAKFGSV